MKTEKNNQLTRLSLLDKTDAEIFKPDIRGWNVLGEKGHKLGVIHDLWVDNSEKKIRYLDILLESNEHFLLPIGLVSLNRNDKYAIAVDVRKADLPKYPVYDGENLTWETERAVRQSFMPRHATLPEEWQSDFYNHNHFNEHSLFGQRQTTRSRIRRTDTEPWG